MNKVKGFSYDTVKHKEIIDHVESQQNQSKYIWGLVKKDMESKSIQEVVRKEIERYLENIEVKSIKKESQDVDTSEINNILAM